MSQFTLSDIREMERMTGASSVWAVIFLSVFCTPERLKQKLDDYRAYREKSRVLFQIKRLEILTKTRYCIWKKLGASDELVDYRLEVLEEDFLEEYKMDPKDLSDKYEGKDTYEFECGLAADVIKRSGIDINYEMAKRERKILAKTDPEAAAKFEMPEDKRDENAELKTRVDIISFIKGKIYNFFNGINDYAIDVLEDDDTEPEVLEIEANEKLDEDPVETLGV